MKNAIFFTLVQVLCISSFASEKILSRQSMRCESIDSAKSLTLNYFIKLYTDNEAYITFSQKVIDEQNQKSYEVSFLSKLTRVNGDAVSTGNFKFVTELNQQLILKPDSQGMVSAEWEDMQSHQKMQLKCQGLEIPRVSP